MYTVPFCGMKFKKAKDKNNDSQSNKTFTMYMDLPFNKLFKMPIVIGLVCTLLRKCT